MHAHEFSVAPADRNMIWLSATFHNATDKDITGVRVLVQPVLSMGDDGPSKYQMDRTGAYKQAASVTINGKAPNAMGDTDFSVVCSIAATKLADGTVLHFPASASPSPTP